MLEIEEQIRRYGTSLTSEVERIDPAVVMARRPAARRDRLVVIGIGVVLVLAVAVSLLVAFDGTRGQHLETVGQPAVPTSTSSPTSDPGPTTTFGSTGTVALPRLLLLQDTSGVRR